MSFADRPIDAFLADVASTTVTPSGGAVAAVVGASGAALCEMACLHTLGTDPAEDIAAQLTAVGKELDASRQRLLALADDDSAAVDRVQRAFDTDDSGAGEPQAALKAATDVPLATAEVCLDVLEHADVVTANTNRSAIADAATGAFLAHGALEGATCIVQTNLATVHDESFVAETAHRSAEIERAAGTAVDAVRTRLDHQE